MESYSILLLICFILDIFFTYFNVYTYRKLYLNKDYHKLELNKIIGFFWRKLGVLKGGILASVLSFLVILAFILYGNFEIKLILIGMYVMIIFYHVNNFSELKQESNQRKGKKPIDSKKLRTIILIVLITLSFIDLTTTYIYIHNYKIYAPERPFNQMESNILLLFLFNLFGLELGIILGALIIWFLLYLVAFYIKGYFGWITTGLIILALGFGIVNNLNHINMLFGLMGV